MPYRLVEIIVAPDKREAVQDLLEEEETLGVWTTQSSENRVRVRALLRTQHTEHVFDRIHEQWPDQDSYRVMLLPVSAILPHEEREAEEEQSAKDKEEGQRGISQDELYHDVREGAQLSLVYVASAVLSSIVASIGIMRGDVTVLIAAIIIAPLVWPSVAFAVAVTLGDLSLVRESLKTYVTGILSVWLVAILLGLFMSFDPQAPLIQARVDVNVGDIALALSAGSAGALTLTSNAPTRLIGIVVAVALLPPLVASGLLLGMGVWDPALRASLLFLANAASLILAAIVTFVLQGIHPRTWRDTEQAKQATRITVGLIGSLLIILLVIVFVSL